MRNIIYISLLAGAVAFPAIAEPTPGCFMRVYDAAHLARQPAQIVEAMWFQYRNREDGPRAMVTVMTSEIPRLRAAGQDAAFFEQDTYCWEAEGQKNWMCGGECDGGLLEITRDDGKVMELRTDYFLMGKTEGPQECGGELDLTEKPMTPVTYRLFRVNDSECEINR